MQAEVRIPVMLRKLTGGAATVTVDGETIGEIIDALDERFAGFRGELVGDDGSIHRFVNIYLNDEDVRFIDGLGTRLSEGDVVSILPAVAGGRS